MLNLEWELAVFSRGSYSQLAVTHVLENSPETFSLLFCLFWQVSDRDRRLLSKEAGRGETSKHWTGWKYASWCIFSVFDYQGGETHSCGCFFLFYGSFSSVFFVFLNQMKTFFPLRLGVKCLVTLTEKNCVMWWHTFPISNCIFKQKFGNIKSEGRTL